MAQIIKMKYENTLRRIALQQKTSEKLTFTELEACIRELFQIPVAAELVVTYTDDDNDVVTMANDHDLKDALVEQSLNPLCLHVDLVKPKSTPRPSSPSGVEKKFTAATDAADEAFKQLLKKLSPTTKSIENLIQSYETVLKGVTSPAQIPGLLENIRQMITSQLTPSARDGVAAVAPESVARPKDHSHQTSDSSSVPSAVNSGSLGASGAAAMPEKDEGSHLGHVVHHGITCDACGVSPIVGTRWKSNMKYDYDLCATCFEKHGNEIEYRKIDQLLFRPRHFHGPHRGPPAMGPTFFHMGPSSRGGHQRSFGMWGPFGGGRHQCNQWMGHGPNAGGRLDARFVCDVTIFDGTEVGTGTLFTKIWRLRNSGTLPWPADTSLVHVGGDDLGHVSSVPLDIPEQGLAPNAELEVSVDLVAPEKPGRYVSYWRLASPSGPKFGHRIWVHIQVVAKEALDEPAICREEVPVVLVLPEGTSDCQASVEVALNSGEQVFDEPAIGQAPPGVTPYSAVEGERSNQSEPARTSANVQVHIENDTRGGIHLTAAEESPVLAPAVGSEGKSIFGVETEKPEAQVLISSAEEAPLLAPAVGSEGKSIVGVEKEKPEAQVLLCSAEEVEGPITYPIVDVGNSLSNAVDGKALLDKLEAMGFADTKLNGELLERNDWDLRRTLDDLCAVEEWDPILGELEEMGFYDKETNRRLMFKNKGSVKHVVKELVQISKGLKRN